MFQVDDVEWINPAHVLQVEDDAEKHILVITFNVAENSIQRCRTARYTGEGRLAILRALKAHTFQG